MSVTVIELVHASEDARSCVTDCYFILLTFANQKKEFTNFLVKIIAINIFRCNFLNSELPDLLHGWDNDVCVVGIFGHSNSSKTKALPINDILGRTVFQVR